MDSSPRRHSLVTEKQTSSTTDQHMTPTAEKASCTSWVMGREMKQFCNMVCSEFQSLKTKSSMLLCRVMASSEESVMINGSEKEETKVTVPLQILTCSLEHTFIMPCRG